MLADQSTRPAKLSKTKSNSKLDFASNVTEDATFRASVDDLKTPPNRESLRQHFTGAFPETQLRPSLEADEPVAESEMRDYRRPSRPASNGSARPPSNELSSSSSTSVNSAEIQRLATVRETGGKPNIGEVIKLLQELRRTASPDEIVALHKALLPQRDSVYDSSQPPSPLTSGEEFPRPPNFARSRSLLPPGIRTRTSSPRVNASESTPRKPRQTRPRTAPVPQTDAATKDVPSYSPTAETVRAATPVDLDAIPMGAYRSGTLRITNGAASPEPCTTHAESQLQASKSAEVRTVDDFQTAPSTPSDQELVNLPHVSRRLGATREAILAFNEKRQQHDRHLAKHSFFNQPPRSETLRRASEPTISSISASSKEEEPPTAPEISQSTSRNVSKSDVHPQRRLHSRSESSKDQNLRLRTSGTRSALEGSYQDRSQQLSNSETATAERHLSDEVKGSGLPRFAQRWSHRISHISPELTQAAQFEGTKPKEPAAVRRSSIQPDTEITRACIDAVQDEKEFVNENVELSESETPEVALAKLTGQADQRAMNAKTPSSVASRGSSVEDVGATQSRSKSNKIDSGYGSDVSPPPVEQQKITKEDKPVNGPLEHVTEQTHKAYGGLRVDEDDVSLYSINHVLRSPYLLSGIAKPSPPSARGSKKHLSLLGIDKETPSDASPEQAASSPGTGVGAILPGLAKSKASKPYKKLQKRLPLSIRNSLRGDAGRRADQHTRLSMARFPLYDDLEDFMQISGNTTTINGSESYAETGELEDPKLCSKDEPAALGSLLRSSHDQSSNPSGAHRKVTHNKDIHMVHTRHESGEESGSRTLKASHSKGSVNVHTEIGSNSEAEEFNARNRIVTAADAVDAHPPVEASGVMLEEAKREPTTTLYQCRVAEQQQPDLPRTQSKRLSGIEFLMASGVARVSSRDLAKMTSEGAMERQRKRSSRTTWSKRFSIQGSSSSGSKDKLHESQQQQNVATRDVQSGGGTRPESRSPSRAERALPHDGRAQAKISPSDSALPGDDIESIADVVKKTVRARKVHEVRRTNETERQNNVYVSEAAKVEAEKRSSQARRPGRPSSSAHGLRSQELVWDQHAKGWQVRRESLGEKPRRPVMVDLTEQLRSTGATALRPPAITVSQPST